MAATTHEIRCADCRAVYEFREHATAFGGEDHCLACGSHTYTDPMSINRPAVLIFRGNTYPHRDALKAAGCEWDHDKKEWIAPPIPTLDQYDRLCDAWR